MTTNYFEHYWRTVQKAMPRVLLMSLGAALVAWLIVRGLGPTYTVHYSYLVSLSEQEEVEAFRFDGYYALSATDLFAATLASWATQPEVIVAAYEQAGIELASYDSRVLARAVEAAKRAPQLVAVKVVGKDRAVAERLAEALQTVMEQNVKRYHDQGIPALKFKVVATDPWTGVSRLSAPVIVGATFVFVLLMSINVVLLLESIKRTT